VDGARDDWADARHAHQSIAAVVALTYRATVDVLACFRKSKAVGAVFGLTTL
jgi:hypothetical protein